MKEAILLRFFIQGKLALLFCYYTTRCSPGGSCIFHWRHPSLWTLVFVLFYMNFISARFSDNFLTRSDH